MLKKILILLVLTSTIGYGLSSNWFVDDIVYSSAGINLVGESILYDQANNLLVVCYMCNDPCGYMKVARYNLSSKEITESEAYYQTLDADVDLHGHTRCGLDQKGFFWVAGGDHGSAGTTGLNVYRGREPYEYLDLINITENFNRNGTYPSIYIPNSTHTCISFRGMPNWTTGCSTDNGTTWSFEEYQWTYYNETSSLYDSVASQNGVQYHSVRIGNANGVSFAMQNQSGFFYVNGSKINLLIRNNTLISDDNVDYLNYSSRKPVYNNMREIDGRYYFHENRGGLWLYNTTGWEYIYNSSLDFSFPFYQPLNETHVWTIPIENQNTDYTELYLFDIEKNKWSLEKQFDVRGRYGTKSQDFGDNRTNYMVISSYNESVFASTFSLEANTVSDHVDVWLYGNSTEAPKYNIQEERGACSDSSTKAYVIDMDMQELVGVQSWDESKVEGGFVIEGGYKIS